MSAWCREVQEGPPYKLNRDELETRLREVGLEKGIPYLRDHWHEIVARHDEYQAEAAELEAARAKLRESERQRHAFESTPAPLGEWEREHSAYTAEYGFEVWWARCPLCERWHEFHEPGLKFWTAALDEKLAPHCEECRCERCTSPPSIWRWLRPTREKRWNREGLKAMRA